MSNLVFKLTVQVRFSNKENLPSIRLFTTFFFLRNFYTQAWTTDKMPSQNPHTSIHKSQKNQKMNVMIENNEPRTRGNRFQFDLFLSFGKIIFVLIHSPNTQATELWK